MSNQRRAESESFRHLRRHVLKAVHDKINAIVEQGVFQFLDENSGAAKFCDWLIEHLVAARAYSNDFEFNIGKLCTTACEHHVRLQQREFAFSRAYAKLGHTSVAQGNVVVRLSVAAAWSRERLDRKVFVVLRLVCAKLYSRSLTSIERLVHEGFD